MKIYLANALFSEADRMYNNYIGNEILKAFKDVELYIPQNNDEINDKSKFANSVDIALADVAKLKESDLLIAVIDGNDVGVSNEIGIAYALDIPIIGLYTDVRQQGRDNILKIDALIKDGTENQFIYHNLMEIGLIKSNGIIVSSVSDVIEQLAEYLNKEKA